MHPLQPATHTYLAAIRQSRARPNATDELSYRTALENYLNAGSLALGRPADFTNEARTGGDIPGRPDMKLSIK